MIANFHFNTETTLTLLFCITCTTLLFVLSIPFPYVVKKRVNKAVSQILYYLMFAAILPLWICLTALRRINTFSQEARDPRFNPLLADKHKGRVIKMQRNFLLGLFGLCVYVLLYRFHKVINRYDETIQNFKEQNEAGSPIEKKKVAGEIPSGGDVSVRQVLETKKNK